ncbi:hypothetical protein C5E02_00850 [Rathayibacter rathayi]|uniref:Nitroreductase domain-containing protein n=1 Tax=Rathayibacter rathayi TaxID=33887 RepID=A0ABX5ADU4_RATRA|nr:hypothetical protein [Rathayibacter rathayi]PPH36789.1 hypothetical protein C5C28_05245 [Rathayibacter rathayi]PPH77411.1 hypothetical protein C5C40_07075 [Rathayibacter rathayi]PPI64778.1 hypothetical protein C5E02_00850 [Rathayibacter rathayi]
MTRIPARDAVPAERIRPAPTAAGGLRTQHELISELQHSVRLSPDQLAVRPLPIGVRRPLVQGVSPVALPAVPVPAEGAHPACGLDDVIEHRESVRFYGEQSVDAAVVARIVRAGHRADAATWPGEAGAGLGIELLVAARRMTGSAPAILRLDGDVFVPLAELDEDTAEDLVLQIEYAWSPVILIAIAPLADALDRWGDHGERLVNTRAAAAVTAALHEACSLGLVGSPFAGFLTSGLRRLLDVDGYANAQLFAASLGHPHPTTTTERTKQ